MKSDKIILWLLLASLCSMSGIAFYYKLGWDRMDKQMREIASDVSMVHTVIKDLSGLYARTRTGIILTELRSQNEDLIVMFGDSIVEQQYFPALDGINVINTGISGARALEAKPFLDSILATSHGPVMALSMGTNDAFGDKVANTQEFAAGYEILVRTILDSGRKLVLVTLPPLEQDKPESRLFNGKSLDEYNDVIRDVAARHGLEVADIHTMLVERRKKLAASQTVDGVHLDPAAAAQWRETVYAAIRRSLAGTAQ